MKVLMIYPKFPAEAFWNPTRSLIRFTDHRVNMPPLGLLTIASYLPSDFEIRLIDRNLKDGDEADWDWADVVFISAMIVQRDDYDVCVAKARELGKPVALGGPMTHTFPEIAVADADWVCFGEAEPVIESMVRDIRADARGKQYHGGSDSDMTKVALPRFDLLPGTGVYASMPIQFSRGCPFRCEFCDIIEIYGRVPRTKRPAQLLGELDALVRHGFRGSVFIVDDNFIGNKKNVKPLLRELIAWNKENGYPYRFMAEASLNVADDEELLELMYLANFVSIFIGIETPEADLLRGTMKLQNIPGDPITKLKRIRKHGLHVCGGFIIGFDDESRDVFDIQRNFIEASGIGMAMIGLLQAGPHTELWRRLKRENRILEGIRINGVSTAEGINFIPKGELTKREYLERYSALAKELYEPEAFFRRIVPALLTMRYRKRHRGLFAVWPLYYSVMMRQVFWLGIRSRETRRHFMRAFLHLLFRNPFALEAFGYECFHFYYLHQHVAFVRRQLVGYLSAPAPTDVLDQVVRADAGVSDAGSATAELAVAPGRSSPATGGAGK